MLLLASFKEQHSKLTQNQHSVPRSSLPSFSVKITRKPTDSPCLYAILLHTKRTYRLRLLSS